MKKIFFWIAAGLVAFAANSQENKSEPAKKSFLAINVGFSIPLLCYASSDITKNTSGYAKTGYTFDVSYGYRFGQNFGITGSVFYSSNQTGKNNIVQSSGNGQFRYVGIVAGPLLTKKLFTKTDGDFKFLAGIAHAWSPKLLYHGETILNNDRNTCFAFSLGMGLRYHISDKTFLSFRVDHTQLDPKFNNDATGENIKREQHIVVMNFDTGFGIKF